MSDNAELKSFLGKLAKLFEAEGDSDTAQALISQLGRRSSADLSEVDAEFVKSRVAQAEKASGIGDYERAIPLYMEALAIREEALGSDHLDSMYSMNALAGCMLRNRESEDAETLYTRLLRIATTSLGRDHKLTRMTINNIATCKEATRRDWAFRRLEERFRHMLLEASIEAQAHRAARVDRLHEIASKLDMRGQYGRALPVFEAWISARLSDADPDDEAAIQDISRYASFLARAGKPDRSQAAYRAVVAFRNRQQHRFGKGARALRLALTDWAQSMDDLGDHASADATRDLAYRIL